jgi:hypothetical protein
MKSSTTTLAGLLLAMLLRAAPTHAQAARDLTDIALSLYQEANAPGALARNKALINAPEAYLVSIYQPGALVMLDKKRVRVPALRYNVALRVLEVRDSTGSHIWPPGSIDGFYMGKGADARHFRTYKVRDGSTITDFVEVLTTADNSPMVLAVQNNYVHEEAQLHPVLHTEVKPARTEIGQVVVAGPNNPKEPLRPIQLTPRGVLRLFGNHAAPVEAFVAKEHLNYNDLGQVLRMVEYYNQGMAKQ